MKKSAFAVQAVQRTVATIKVAGIIAAVAMVGFSVMGCPANNEPPESWRNPPAKLVGDWSDGLMSIMSIESDGSFNCMINHVISSSGNFKTDGDRFKVAAPGLDTTGTWTLNDGVLSLKCDYGIFLTGDWIKQE